MTGKSRRRKATRQLESVRAMVRDCSSKDVRDLFLMHDLEIYYRAKHDMAEHSAYPHSFPIPRHRMLAPGVVRKAIKLNEEFRDSCYY